jgi:hypothetical protein
MKKEELINKLEELRDVKDYSHYELTNKGYREGLLDALDLVNKYFDLPPVVRRSEQLKCQCKKAKFTRTVDADFNPLCGRCGKAL